MLSLAADAVEELSKESPSGEVVEYKTKDFLKTLEVYIHVESVCLPYLLVSSTLTPHTSKMALL